MANPEKFTINDLVANGSRDVPAGNTVDTAGIVPIETDKTDLLFIDVANTAGQALTVTVLAGSNPPSHLSQAQSVVVPATTGRKLIGPFESQRCVQADGKVHVQFTPASSTPTATVRVMRLPKL